VRDTPLRRGPARQAPPPFGSHRIAGRTFTGTVRYKNAKIGEQSRWNVARSA